MTTKTVNAVKGKQGFQPTVKECSNTPLATEPFVVDARDMTIRQYAEARADLENTLHDAQNAVASFSFKYGRLDDIPEDIRDEWNSAYNLVRKSERDLKYFDDSWRARNLNANLD